MEEIFEKKPVKIVEIPLMTAGLCGYGDSGNVYIKDSTMYDIMPKLLGISLIITHQGKEAVGEVVEVFQNPNDTDQWIGKISVRSEEAKRLLEAGWGVSTAYRIIKDTGVSGKWNNIDYTTEVQDVEWLHVAVVENPRYTIAKDGVFINSKDNIVYSQILKKERKPMFNLFKTKKEKINLNEDEKIYVKLDEEDIELKDLIEMVKEKEEEKKAYAEDDMVIELNGESITVKELIEKYNACKKNACGKKNEEEKEEVEIKEEKKENEEEKEEVEIKEEKKENEEEKEEVKIEEEKKENEEDKDEDKKDNEEEKEEIKEEKKEIKNSIDLRTAYINRGSDVATRHDYLTTKERMELAHKKYGSDK